MCAERCGAWLAGSPLLVLVLAGRWDGWLATVLPTPSNPSACVGASPSAVGARCGGALLADRRVRHFKTAPNPPNGRTLGRAAGFSARGW